MDTAVVAPVQALEGLRISTRGEDDVLSFLVWVLDHDQPDRGFSKTVSSSQPAWTRPTPERFEERKILAPASGDTHHFHVRHRETGSAGFVLREENHAMEVMPIDLTAIISVIMGISIVLIPVIGLTARFALKPVVEALARVFESRGMNESMQIMERRMALMEAQVEAMGGTMKRLEETSTFDAQLRTGSEGARDRLPAP